MNNFKVINSNTIIKDLEEENKKLKSKIKILQSKVKTYEADIEAVNKEKLRTTLRSANDLKGTTKLFVTWYSFRCYPKATQGKT